MCLSRFVVRDFEFDPKGADKENKDKDSLLTQRSKQQVHPHHADMGSINSCGHNLPVDLLTANLK